MNHARRIALIVSLTSFEVCAQSGVPPDFAGKWVCQSSNPGYNLPIPGRDPSTERMTTAPVTVVMTFFLRVDGIYEAAKSKGRYSFRADSMAIDWLDGPHKERFSKTRLSRRSNGAPALSLIANQRYYGCFLSGDSEGGVGAAASRSEAPTAKETDSPPSPSHGHSREEMLARGREGARAYNSGDLKRARTIFEELVKAEPNSSDAEAALAAVLIRTGENENALSHLNRALELNPREISAYVNRGEVYFKLGRRREAEADLKKAIALDGSGRNPAANRARTLLKNPPAH